MKIEVTQEDIDKGIPEDSLRCPIGRAMYRTTGGVWMVYKNVMVPWQISCWKTTSLPDIAEGFIKNFDKRLTVKPFTFEIE
jgi:hypothetical protein